MAVTRRPPGASKRPAGKPVPRPSNPTARPAKPASGSGKPGSGSAKSGSGSGKSGSGSGKSAPGRPAARPARAASPRPAARPLQALGHGPAPRSLRGSVSPTSAERFARRVRARRRRRALIGLLVVTLLAGIAWAALRSPWATVQRIEVSGTDRVDVAAVRAEADTELGHPMLLARTGDIESRVARLRLVRAVTVERHWPSTVRVRVTERVPVAVLPSGSGLVLVDRDGVEIEAAAAVPAGLPLLQVERGARGVPALRGCLAVLAGLPAELSSRLAAIGADSPDGIWLRLRPAEQSKGKTAGADDQIRVEWGGSSETPRKAEVLTALMRQKGRAYDVRSPDNPAVVRTP